MGDRKKIIQMKKRVLKAAKTALGSSVAIYIAHILHLDYEISAGTIALLTIVTTKWETLKLSLFRMITLLITIVLAWVVFFHVGNEWVAYGIFVFLSVIICEMFGWGATLSVNAVIGAHFLTRLEFSRDFIINESLLVLIGITIAIVLNLFHVNEESRKALVTDMRETEKNLQMILEELAVYLSGREPERDVWKEIRDLEEKLKQYIMDACEYQNNTFSSHPGYYIDYFEMRMQQCNMLDNLHYEMTKIREMPVQAQIIADYIMYMKAYVIEKNFPDEQIKALHKIFEGMKQEPLPVSRPEFESRAILYHVLMDLEDFLLFKKKFVEELSKQKRMIYWEKDA